MGWSTEFVRRLWRLRPWNPNPLMRGSDRCQVVIRMFVVALALLAVPVAGTVGTCAYTSSAESIAASNAGKVRVVATVVTAPRRATSFTGSALPRYEKTVRWEHGGRIETATVPSEATAVVGAELPMWLGPDGRPADPPRQPAGAAADGICIALVVLVASWCAAVGIDRRATRLLDRRRAVRWDAEWRGYSRPIET